MNVQARSTMRNDSLTRALALCGIVGPIQFIVVPLVSGLLRSGYDPMSQYMSELGAVGAPNAIVWFMTEFLLGLMMIAFAFGLHRGISEGKGSKLAPILLVVSGIGWIAGSIFRCDAGCVNESVTGTMHGLVGMFGPIPLIIAPLAILPRLKKDNRWQSYRPFSQIMGALGVLFFCVMFSGEVSPALEPYRGLLQRLAFFTPLLWTVVMAIGLLRLSKPDQTGSGFTV